MNVAASDRGEYIAPGTRPVVEAFRTAGAIGFQDLDISLARSNYLTSCRKNGISAEDVGAVEDLTIPGGPRVRTYRPRGSDPGAPLPVVLFAHGGGWVIGSVDTHDSICRRVSNQTGAVVVAVDYRLAPEYPYPAALNDVRAADGWLGSGDASVAIDPDRIAFMGDSAGGQIVAVLTRERVLAGSPPIAQVLLYPVTDCAMDSPSYERVTEGFPLTAASMRWFFSLYAPDGPDVADPGLSPLRALDIAGMPDSFVCTVDNDPLADEGIEYASKLARTGATVEHVHLAGYHHGLFTSAKLMPLGVQILDRAAAFLRERFVAERSVG